jgi:glycosyltransferase involved in cell wall biosynthesis
MARDEGDIRIVTFGAVGLFEKELADLQSEHVQISMDRFVAPKRDIQYFWQLYSRFRRGGFDAVVTFTTKPNIYGVMAAAMARVPRIALAVRGLGRAFDEPESFKDRMLRGLLSVLYKLSCSVCTIAWFTNPNDVSHFISRRIVSPEKVFLTKNAVDLSVFHPNAVSAGRIDQLRRELGFREHERIVIMVARLIWSKGVNEFIEAAGLLSDRLPDVRFLLVAPREGHSHGAIPEDYVRKSESMRPNFTWLGFRKDVIDLYALSELAVLPSYYKEGGYPRALLEPMAMGKPVIAADTSDCRSPVEPGKNGYLVPPRDSVALASAIADIITNEDRRKSFGEYSLKKARAEYDDKVVVRQVLNRLIFGT